eukprot:11030340-Karenia_brevis.AAC.1
MESPFGSGKTTPRPVPTTPRDPPMLGPRPEIDPRSVRSGSQSYRDGIAAQAPQGGWKGAAE